MNEEEQEEQKCAYMETFVSAIDGRTRSVHLRYPSTYEQLVWEPAQQRWYERRWGVKRTVSRVDDSVLQSLLELLGMDPASVCAYISVRDPAVSDECSAYGEETMRLAREKSKAKSSAKSSSTQGQLSFGAPASRDEAGTIVLKPRRRR
ncbi:hypothetical protein ACFLUT_03390 [Chloroflexota bacterium]